MDTDGLSGLEQFRIQGKERIEKDRYTFNIGTLKCAARKPTIIRTLRTMERFGELGSELGPDATPEDILAERKDKPRLGDFMEEFVCTEILHPTIRRGSPPEKDEREKEGMTEKAITKYIAERGFFYWSEVPDPLQEELFWALFERTAKGVGSQSKTFQDRIEALKKAQQAGGDPEINPRNGSR